MNLHAIHIQRIKLWFFVVSFVKITIFVKEFGLHKVPTTKNVCFFVV